MAQTAASHPFQSFRTATALALGLLAFMGAISDGARAADAPTASLTVTFTGIKTPSGSIMVALADRAAFDGKAADAGHAAVVVKGESVTAVFTGLTPGAYAIRAFHDLNGDGQLNTNPFGIPIEPYAFSNDARGAMGPPAWDAATFTVKVGDNAQTIVID